MKYLKFSFLVLLVFVLNSCVTQRPKNDLNKDLVITFGSCSNQEKENQLWQEIANENPSVFIWTGDAVYPKIYDLEHLKLAFDVQKNNEEYQDLSNQTEIIGVYDDHDYGLNDGGIENPIKKEVKELFADFIDLKMDKELQNRNGLFYAKSYPTFSTELIILDTRYNRSELQKSENPDERYSPKVDGQILGEEQWAFLVAKLKQTKAKNIIIVSSIQLLNNFHGYEKWGNIISEREKMINLLKSYSNKNIIVLSGDRHYGEVSTLDGITEITSSGLTEVYTKANEPNPLRISDIIVQPNYGKIVIGNKGDKFQFYLKGENQETFYQSK